MGIEPVDENLSATADLLVQARAGDPHAKAELLERYRGPLGRLLHARLAPSAQALHETNDLVQETLIAGLANLERFEHRGVGSFWGYLRAIGLRRVQQVNRPKAIERLRTREADLSQHADSRPSPDDLLSIANQHADFERALGELNEPTRSAVLLSLELGLSHREIARECGFLSPDAARMAITRGLARLAKELAARMPD